MKHLSLLLVIGAICVGIASLTYISFRRNQPAVAPGQPEPAQQQEFPDLGLDENDNLDDAFLELEAVAGY